ncbi:MAG: hypothetical protein F4Y31_11450 [Gammaproteobacteria bacterium]|nr:hypothetical protein [Gammaproteobacteria bacterium]MYF66510.1 hypothetical protein [Gammaproteobacteria bacterium]MYK37178.1 hypothetical protein [Gammaproteobacteria bacterium]
MTQIGLPYRIRPNKFIDRELFAELVSLLVAEADPGEYAYVSMGGKHLSDHLAMYRRAGIRKLYAFDNDPRITDRQRFNAPFEGVICESHGSEELPADIQEIVTSLDANRVIIWLDFTTAEHFKQLKEVEAITAKLASEDILRVTMNIEFSNLMQRTAELTAAQRELSTEEQRALLLRRYLGVYMPRDLNELSNEGIAVAVARSIERACELGGRAADQRTSPVPLLVTNYKDTTSMLTATFRMTNGTRPLDPPKGWQFLPGEGLADIEKIVAPDLSPREQYALDKCMHEDADVIQEKLGFDLDGPAIGAYERFHRFFPTFQSVNE